MEYFPIDVWECILREIMITKDYANCTRTCKKSFKASKRIKELKAIQFSIKQSAPSFSYSHLPNDLLHGPYATQYFKWGKHCSESEYFKWGKHCSESEWIETLKKYK